MSLKMILLVAAVPIFFICWAILFKYRDRFKKPPKQQRGHRKIKRVPGTVITICLDEIPDNQNEADEKMAKAIFISADCWLCVFDLLSPRQLGLGIALISHRFDYYVDEHFKTRKWALESIRIRSKIGKNGKKKMEIVKYYDGETLPIPQIQLPRKVIGFVRIDICFIDQNVIAFLHRFRQLFASFCPINLYIYTASDDRILEFILRNIWPMFATNIHGILLPVGFFRRLRKFVPSFPNDCPSLRVVNVYYDDFFVEFSADDNATASDGQALAKWLTTRNPNNVPKVLKCWLHNYNGNWPSRIEAFKAAFASASSPINFIVSVCFLPPSSAASVVPFELTNELTHEQLALKRTDHYRRFLLVRCPIARDASKWTKWEKEAIGWEIYFQRNAIYIQIDDKNKIGGGLFDAIPGLSDQQQK